MSRVCLVGAGSISRVHAEAVGSLAGHSVTCVVDPNLAAAQGRATTLPGTVAVFQSVAEAVAADAFDRAHVLVPPPLHEQVATALLTAGKPVLLEKPMATSSAGCQRLIAQAAANDHTPLGVNQNFVYHPAFVRLRNLVESGALGRPNFVDCVYNVPLRQMVSRQFGHWMFREPVNILLEQAVHPLSQIAVFAGGIGVVQAIAGPAMEVGGGATFHPSLTATLTGAKMPASLRFAVGQNFPFWQVGVVCDDGVAVADILGNRLLRYGRTRYLEISDALLSGLSSAGGLAGDSFGNAAGAALSLLRLRSSNDPFFRSMRASIAAFHAAVDSGGAPPLDGKFGGDLVAACELLAAAGFADRPKSVSLAPSVRTPAVCDVAVLGGTGFIGAHVVARLLAAGHRVSVMARNVRDLPAPFDHENVVLHRGDIADSDSVRNAVAHTPVVVNLAHGGGGQNWEQIRDAMVGGAETVARACLDLGTRLLHIGSIASLYLGPQRDPVTGATPPDPEPDRRADYARAKILCDRMLLGLHAAHGLNVCILRPGLVVGQGGSPFHTGVGFYNSEQHCIGWNAGTNPLPFVLADDVAEAIFLACTAPNLEGRCYNLVGEVRLTARDYIAELGQALRRPLQFHPQSPRYLWIEDAGKWALKRVAGRRGALPSLHDLLSRGLMARFDCADVAGALGWRPVADRERFVRDAILVHAQA